MFSICTIILLITTFSSARVDTRIHCHPLESSPFYQLQVSGYEVLFTDFIRYSDFSVHEITFWPKPCNGRNVKELTISSNNVVKVNHDIIAKGLELNVTITSPLLLIIGHPKIILSGLDGDKKLQANSGSSPGEDGANGAPGSSGTSGGIFLANVESVRRIENLFIETNGGNGGDGQQGGNGADGTPGMKQSIFELPSPFNNWKTCERSENKIEMSHSCKVPHGILATYKLFEGNFGGKGGNGGNGGPPGKAGLPGEVEVIVGGEEIYLSVSKEMGKAGTPGRGGQGGLGGLSGNYLECVQKIKNSNQIQSCYSRRSNERGPSGSSGEVGGLEIKSPGVKKALAGRALGNQKRDLRMSCKVVDSTCQMIVEEEYIRLKDLEGSGCSAQCGNTGSVEILVFAKVVVFDGSVNFPGKTLIVIAEKWSIPNPVTITLNGITGEAGMQGLSGVSRMDQDSNVYLSNYDVLRKARAPEAVRGDNGERGKDGKQGGNSGNFFGLYGTIINPQNLKIEAKGGAGGQGGKGGNGGDPGGVGGPGGNAGPNGNSGVIEIIHLNPESCENSQARIKKLTGYLTGKPGEGGKSSGISSFTKYKMKYNIWNGKELGMAPYQTTEWQYPSSGPQGSTSSLNYNQNTGVFYKIPKYLNMFKQTYFLERLRPSKFFEAVDYDDRILTSYTTVLRITEDIRLIENGFQLQRNYPGKIEDYKGFYSRQLNKVIRFAQIAFKNRPMSHDEKFSLKRIFAALVSKMIELKDEKITSIAINPKGFFDILLENLNNIKEEQLDYAITNRLKTMANKINHDIQNTEALIEGQVLNELNKVRAVMLLKMEDLEYYFEGMIEAAKGNAEALEEHLGDLEEFTSTFIASGLSRVFFSFVRYATGFLHLMGPAAYTAGRIIGNIGDLVETGVEHFLPEMPTLETERNPESDFSHASEEWLNEELEKLSWVKDIAPERSEFNEDIAVLQNNYKQLEEAKISRNFGRALLIEPELHYSLKNLEERILNKMNHHRIKRGISVDFEDVETSEIFDGLATATAGSGLLSSVFSFVDSVKDYEKNKNKIRKAIVAAKGTIYILERKLTKMYSTFFPMIENVIEEVTKDEKVEAFSIDFMKFKVQDVLNELKASVDEFALGQEIGEPVKTCIDKLIELTVLRFDLYKNIDQFNQRKELAELIAQSNSHEMDSIEEPNLRAEVQGLELLIKAGQFQDEYLMGLHTFLKWSFPFAYKYFGEQLQVDNFISRDDETVTRVFENYRTKITQLRNILHLDSVAIISHDELFDVHEFKHEEDNSPFAFWNSEEFPEAINGLLKGQEVELKAMPNAFHLLNKLSAVKFSTIYVNFYANDPKEQGNLDKALTKFKIKFKHSGISYFYVADKEFVFVDNPVSFEYSYKKSNNKPLTYNQVWSKLTQESNALLSPFTTWTMQLKKAALGTKIKFSSLEKFMNRVSIALEGEGHYLKEIDMTPKEIKLLKLEKYYNEYKNF